MPTKKKIKERKIFLKSKRKFIHVNYGKKKHFLPVPSKRKFLLHLQTLWKKRKAYEKADGCKQLGMEDVK